MSTYSKGDYILGIVRHSIRFQGQDSYDYYRMMDNNTYVVPTIEVGQKVRFDPWKGITVFGSRDVREEVIGEVVYVNKEHKWFSVVYGKNNIRTSYNFVDIGVDVFVVE